MKRVSYSSEIKWKCVELRAAILITKDFMNELNIRNRTQVYTWWRWYLTNTLKIVNHKNYTTKSIYI